MKFKLIRFLLGLLPLQNIILFESKPDLSDNTKAVFDEMLRRGLNQKYKFVWLLHRSDTPLPDIKNVRSVSYGSLLRFWFRATSKCLICCNSWVKPMHPKQHGFYLSHGTPIKSVRNYYSMPPSIQYCLAAGDGAIPILMHEFNIPREKIFVCGFPRNDILTHSHRDLHPLFPDCNFQKIFVWYPTFRQSMAGQAVPTHALPLLNDPDKAIALNACARENQTLIVLKPHFMQDTRQIKALNLSHIRFIDDRFFVNNHISSYEFVGSCDALITDYSSIYYDYLLCNKPIALIWEDYEIYKQTQGFAPGVEDFLSGGEKVYTLEDFQRFIRDVAEGRDNLQAERNRICDQVNYARDEKNTERVVDFILKKLRN